MSWTFPGWKGAVYSRESHDKSLSAQGLPAYAAHPLLGAVEIDRSYYEPLRATVFSEWRSQVPDGFRFVVKAHEECTVLRFPAHPRYGKKGAQPNQRFLDAHYARDAVVGPVCEGLGEKLGVLLFQFPPQAVGGAREFAHALRAFLSRLPAGVPYAVEIRNPELLTPDYAAALSEGGAVHCHNAWGAMPTVLQQAKALPPATRRPLLIRWLLRPGDAYDEARSRYAPFSRLVDPDPLTRDRISELVVRAIRYRVPAFVLINNKAEGSAPESAFELARSIAARASSELPPSVTE